MTIKTKHYCEFVIVIWLTGPVISIASATGLDAGQLLNEQQRLQPKNQLKINESEPEEKELKLDRDNAADKFKIKSIHFRGAENLVSDSQLQQWVANAINQELAFPQLEQLVEHVSRQLRDAGYLLAKAYLPKQDITEGVIQINIVQGLVDQANGLSINGKNLRIYESRLHNILQSSVRPGQALLKPDLERSLLLINDLPGMNAQASLGSGSSSGTSKVTINTSEGSLITGGIWADNFGNHYTGTCRGNGMVNINDPLKIGDQLRLNMTGSEGIIMGSARYSLPLMANGLGLEMHYSNLQYQIGRELSRSGLEGEASTAGSSLTYPFIRSRALSLVGSVGYEHRALRDKGLAGVITDRQINEAVANINANTVDSWLGGGISNARIGLVSGDLDRSNNAGDFKADAKDAKTQGAFAKFTYSAARLQKLSNQFSFYSTINGQQASGNLDSSEKFILGGPSGVRAYSVGEASGDHGWVINTELRWDVPYPFAIGNLQVVGFIDTGHITLHDQAWNGALTSQSKKNNYQLSGGGISLTLAQANRYQISGTWAAPIGNNAGRDKFNHNTDGQSDDHHFWLQAMVWF
jgi:hemolysin activation/secretion protein